jgi:type III pantothenate kinase
MTTLCFDFGNTRLKCAVFNDSHLTDIIVLPDDHIQTVASILSKFNPVKSILSSVINHDKDMELLLAQKTQFHLLSHLTRANFTSLVGKPETIGADRLALAAAAVHYFPSQNTLVVAVGSCITTNFINQNHEFIGGSISPGMEMRFKALQVFTAKLPLVEKNWNYPLIGYDTKTNIQSGVLSGMAYEIDGFISAYQEKYGNFNAVLTGGDTIHFAQRLKNRIFADQNFLFKGLYALSETNNV